MSAFPPISQLLRLIRVVIISTDKRKLARHMLRGYSALGALSTQMLSNCYVNLMLPCNCLSVVNTDTVLGPKSQLRKESPTLTARNDLMLLLILIEGDTDGIFPMSKAL